jgi:hypothetical protein
MVYHVQRGMSADPSLSGIVGRRNDYGHDGIEGGAVMEEASISAESSRYRAFIQHAANSSSSEEA